MSFSRNYVSYRKRGSRYKVGSRGQPKYQVRKTGAYGLYRSTKFARLRAAARTYGRLTIPRYLNPFPNTRIVRHKYVDVIDFPAGGGAGILQYWQFRCNSMYDPDESGVGHQPMFRDEMAAQYSYYTVLRSKIDVTIAPEQSTKLNILLYVDDDGSVSGSNTALLEQRRFKANIKLDKRQTPLTLTAYYDAAKWNKTNRKGIMSDADQKIASGSSPSAPVLKRYNLVMIPVNSTETVPAQKVVFTQYFMTAWREPVDHVGS